jgi:hypothetical protein
VLTSHSQDPLDMFLKLSISKLFIGVGCARIHMSECMYVFTSVLFSQIRICTQTFVDKNISVDYVKIQKKMPINLFWSMKVNHFTQFTLFFSEAQCR